MRLRAILAKGLEATADLWPDVRIAFGWVHRAAVVLRNGLTVDEIKELLLQTAIYSGVPDAYAGFRVAERVIAEESGQPGSR